MHDSFLSEASIYYYTRICMQIYKSHGIEYEPPYSIVARLYTSYHGMHIQVLGIFVYLLPLVGLDGRARRYTNHAGR